MMTRKNSEYGPLVQIGGNPSQGKPMIENVEMFLPILQKNSSLSQPDADSRYGSNTFPFFNYDK